MCPEMKGLRENWGVLSSEKSRPFLIDRWNYSHLYKSFTYESTEICCKFYEIRKIYIFRKILKLGPTRRKFYEKRKISGMNRSPID